MEQRSNHWRHTRIYLAFMTTLVPLGASAQTLVTTTDPLAFPSTFTFSTVANMQTLIPGSSKYFNSFNQPSVNANGLVVLRGRSKGGDGGGGEGEVSIASAGDSGSTTENKPVRGVYTRQMGSSPGALTKVFDNSTTVPQPNNTTYNGALSTMTEFPAFPRIGIESDTVLTRAQARPVWTYTLPDLTETKVGTSGVYAVRLGESVSAMTQLGMVPPTATYDFSYYAVPGAPAGTKFDQFPGAPAVSGWNTVVFKGNYTLDAGTANAVSKTGIFFRTFSQAAPNASTQMIASSGMPIPGVKGAVFGSTAPPSASDIDVVFLGLDNEASPGYGAIYQAALAPTPPLKPLVKIQSPVPGEQGARFERLGEALSYDGRFVAFWGGWGGMRDVTVKCPQDGNKDVIAYCKLKAPNQADFSYTVQVPVKQGFFVYNVQNGQMYTVAKTGSTYSDFLYWTFSGRPPGAGDSDSEDFEDPRWRSAAFAAVWSIAPKAHVAFKGRRTVSDSSYIDGIYLTQVGPSAKAGIVTVAETGQDGDKIDASAVAPPTSPYAGNPLPITALGIERDGLRNGWLAIVASMTNGTDSQAGVYVTRTVK